MESVFLIAVFTYASDEYFVFAFCEQWHWIRLCRWVPAMAISSTDCRTRAAEGRPVWYLVPDGVVQYIAKRGLYQDVHADRAADRQARDLPPTGGDEDENYGS